MHKFISFIKEFRIPKKQELHDALASFSQNQFLLLILSLIVALVSVVIILGKINSKFTVEVPASGGAITEGIIGTPTLINPVLAISDADKDLTSIVYSGLMRKKSDGSFIPDLAESYTVSKDGTIYTFIIKKNAKFQDGTKVSADDVVFTINKIKDPLIKSPRKLSWDGVDIEKKDDATVVFTLKQPYISFLDNTTIGILPMHIWKNVNNQEFALSILNIKAIGSGPFSISSVAKNSEGVPTSYELKRFNDFALGTPHIKKLTIVSYANEKDLLDALTSHNIDQASGLSPENSEDIKDAGYTIHTATLPRIFGIFFNSNNNKIFSDQNVINAFNKALDRKAIVDGVLSGYGTATESPVPETIIEDNTQVDPVSIDEAKNILDKSGWVLEHLRLQGPMFEQLGRQFDEVAQHLRARQRGVGDVGQQAMQPVAVAPLE
jgi:peptide/nickel transport system substrate-binding protein